MGRFKAEHNSAFPLPEAGPLRLPAGSASPRGVSAPLFPTPRRCWGPSSADPHLLRAPGRLPGFLRPLAHLSGGRNPSGAFPRGVEHRLPELCLLLRQLPIPLPLEWVFLRWSGVRRAVRL